MKNKYSLKNRFSKYESEFDASQLSWEKMSGPILSQVDRANQKEKRRKLAGFLIYGLGALGVGLYVFFPSMWKEEVESTVDIQSIKNVLNVEPEEICDTIFYAQNASKEILSNYSLDTPANPKSTAVNLFKGERNNTIIDQKNNSSKTSDEVLTENSVTEKSDDFSKRSEIQEQEATLEIRENLFIEHTISSIASFIEDDITFEVEGIEVVKTSHKHSSYLYVYSGINLSQKPVELKFLASKPGWQMGITYVQALNSHFTAALGLEYMELNYLTNFTKIDTVNLYRPNTISSITTYQPSGIVEYEYTDSIQGEKIWQVKNYNSIRRVQIPLELGWSTNFKMLNVGIAGGSVFTIFSAKKGRYFDNNFEEMDLSNQERFTFNANLFLKGHFIFPIAESIDLLGMVRIQQMNQKLFDLKLNDMSTQFNLGLRYRI